MIIIAFSTSSCGWSLKKKNIPHFSLQKDQELESQLDDILFIIVVPKLAKTLSPPTPSLLVRK
jgi:hypothetical protein